MAIKIQKRVVSRQFPEGYRDQLLTRELCVRVDAKEIWEDTLVEEIFMDHVVVREVVSWVNNSLELDPVPEVAGFLLGANGLTSSGNYWVSFERFIPSKDVLKKNPTSIEFGIKPLQELDRIREEFPQWDIIGWFHTHPGHSPYLSATDLYTHNGFFQRPYQVAVVLDSLTDQFLTGFFTRKKDRKVNNVPCKLPWIKWKSWLSET